MKRIIGVVAGAILLSGCATIVGDETQLVQVNSNPSGASFKVKDESGVIVAQGKTPQGVTLAKSDGSYFGKKELPDHYGEGWVRTSYPANQSQC